MGVRNRVAARRRSLPWAVAVVIALAGCGGSRPLPQPPAPDRSAAQFGANVARIPGVSAADVTAAAVLAAYPPSASRRPSGWVLTTPHDWRQALVAAQFGARPVHAALLLTNPDFVPTPSQDVMGRLSATGFPRSSGMQTLMFGRFGRDVLLSLTQLKLKVAQLLAPDVDRLNVQLVPYRGGFGRGYSSSVLIVSSEQRDYALPAGAWSAFSGDTVAFVSHDSIPAATRALLAQRQSLLAAKPSIYILGPTSVISPAVEAQLSAYGTVKRIAGANAVDTAVAFARYRDPATGFGWGLSHGPASVSLVDTRSWGNAVAAFNLAATGPQAPLLLTDGPGPLPAPVVGYLHQLQSTAPSQGFVLGDTASISSATLRELDRDLSPLGTAPTRP